MYGVDGYRVVYYVVKPVSNENAAFAVGSLQRVLRRGMMKEYDYGGAIICDPWNSGCN